MRIASRITRWLRRRRAENQPDFTVHDGITLPAPKLRFGGRYFKEDKDFLESAQHEARRLQSHFHLDRKSRLLEIGCGPGRLPIGILTSVGDIASYLGVDVNKRSVDWCRRHIEPHHPSFHFVHLDVANRRYNQDGTLARARLPADDRSFDIVYLYSVFSHLLREDVEHYLGEIGRVLRPGGGVFLTAFVEENVADVAENPPDYQGGRWQGALHCVLYDRHFLEGLLSRQGLVVDRFEHGQETDRQSAYYLSLPA